MQSDQVDQKYLKNTIYIIDDDDDILQSLVVFFQMKGFKVKGFSSAIDYLTELDDAQGCLISDVSMPEMNGIELLEKLNQTNQLRPVLLITGVATVNIAVKAMRLGAADFIEKPFLTDRLLTKVLEILEKSEAAFKTFGLYKSLTKREAHIFDLVAQNLSNQQISEKLFITVSTVEKHRSAMMKKMKFNSLGELMQKHMHIKKALKSRPIEDAD